MQFMMLIYHQEADWSKKSAEDREAMYREYREFRQNIVNDGQFRAGSELAPVSSATTVRIREGKRQVTDGPFVETKEQLGGYFLIEARSFDEAIAIAAKIPSASVGSIEVRPIVEHNQPS